MRGVNKQQLAATRDEAKRAYSVSGCIGDMATAVASGRVKRAATRRSQVDWARLDDLLNRNGAQLANLHRSSRRLFSRPRR